MMQRALPILLVVVAIGIFFAYTNPTYGGAVASARTEVKSLDSALEAADAFKDRENQLERERLALPADDLERLRAFLPDNVNNIQLILDLNDLARRSNIRLSNFNVGASGQEGTEEGTGDEGGSLSIGSTEAVESIEITLTAEGGYEEFRSFLEATEQSLRILDLVGINIRSGNAGAYTFNMTFRIYWLK